VRRSAREESEEEGAEEGWESSFDSSSARARSASIGSELLEMEGTGGGRCEWECVGEEVEAAPLAGSNHLTDLRSLT
jgi:hypothetical protein